MSVEERPTSVGVTRPAAVVGTTRPATVSFTGKTSVGHDVRRQAPGSDDTSGEQRPAAETTARKLIEKHPAAVALGLDHSETAVAPTEKRPQARSLREASGGGGGVEPETSGGGGVRRERSGGGGGLEYRSSDTGPEDAIGPAPTAADGPRRACRDVPAPLSDYRGVVGDGIPSAFIWRPRAR